MTIVTKDNLEEVSNKILRLEDSRMGLDTETYGLGWYDRPFSIIIATSEDEYYFNFNVERDIPTNARLTIHDSEVRGALQLIFSNKRNIWFIHNAKFDMHKLKLIGLDIAGDVFCTLMMARLLNNTHASYTLDAVAKRNDYAKDMSVENYIKERKLFDEDKNPLYCKVPFEMITKYGCKDAWLHRQLGLEFSDGFS